MLPPSGKHRTWTRDGFLISTDPSLIPLSTLNDAFASDALYWAKGLPEKALRATLDGSLSFGLYSPTGGSLPVESAADDAAETQGAADVVGEVAARLRRASLKGGDAEGKGTVAEGEDAQPALIGYARVITDGVTFAYLTDVYVLDAWRGQKLGEWLVGCVREVVEAMPHLRRSMAILGDKSLVAFYQRTMGMEVMKGDEGPAWVIQKRGRGSSFA